MSNALKLNKLEKVAQCLSQELVIVLCDGLWVITENISDCYAFELPITIGETEAKGEAWLIAHLSETAGV